MFYLFGDSSVADFNTAPQTVRITPGTDRSTVNIPVLNDNIVEGNEMFTMNLNVPDVLGPGIIAGATTMATGIIIDTSSELQPACHFCVPSYLPLHKLIQSLHLCNDILLLMYCVLAISISYT